MDNGIKCPVKECGFVNLAGTAECVKCGASLTPVAEEFALPIEGFQGTPEEIERQWFEKVYLGRGDTMKQLTWRAVIMGSVLGGVLSLTNIYIGLKAGWGSMNEWNGGARRMARSNRGG